MRRRPDPHPRNRRYALRFGLGAVGLVGATLLLVLFVLPQRYVLSSGFVESGRTFPNAKAPFAPDTATRVRPYQPLPPPATFTTVSRPFVPAPGPAEVLWNTVLPLLRNEQFEATIPHFERYLASHTTDIGVRREFARTLAKAGRVPQAVAVFNDVLLADNDPVFRLEAARTLRDLKRVNDASVHYGVLLGANPGDAALSLEWAMAYAWEKRYEDAERILLNALARDGSLVTHRVELGRIYFSTNRLREADATLSMLSNAALSSVNAIALRDDVRAALAPPAVARVTPPPQPSLLERAAIAREAKEFNAALEHLNAALRERPNDPAIWLASANIYEYELRDYERARNALAQVERTGGLDAHQQLRLATLESWTGRRTNAMARLDTLRASLATPPRSTIATRDTAPVTIADVVALKGDLQRGDGNQVAADARYREAIALDPANKRALDGLQAVRTTVARIIEAHEVPRLGTVVSGTGDTDDYGRMDVAAEWAGIRGDWAWHGTVGQRWLQGLDLAAAPGDDKGVFAEFSPARWWRLGTIRTGVTVGAQTVRSGEVDASVGASARYRAYSGASVSIEFRHEPAYIFAGTLQSVRARVVQDRGTATFDLPFKGSWYLAFQGDASRIDPADIDGANSTIRVQGVASLSKAMNDNFSLGWTATGLRFSEPAPLVAARRLFWDPSVAVSSGPFARVHGFLADGWQGSLRLNPGLAYVKEFDRTGGAEWLATVPQIAGEAGISYKGRNFSSAFDLFYSQGARADAYRIYGLRFTLSAASWLSDRPRE